MGPTGDVFVCDSGNNRIQKFDNDGNFLLQWGTPGTAPGQFSGPTCIAIDDAGTVYVGENGNLRVQMFDPMGNALGLFPVSISVEDLDVDPGGTFVAIASQLSLLASYTTAGAPIAFWQPTNPSILADIEGVAIGLDGRIYVPLKGFGRIEVFSSVGGFLSQIAFQCAAIDVDNEDNLYLFGVGSAVYKVTNTGQIVWQFGSSGSGNGQFTLIEDLVVDRDGNIFTVESAANRVQKFMSDSTPAIRVSWGAVKSKYQ